jgi:hypothetical protein
MRRPLLLLLAVGAGAACGATLPHRVKGATFELSSKEIGLADEYERDEPRTGEVQVRCDYWTKRREDANGNHLVGLFSWPPEYFQTLRAWAEAKKAEVCDVAKAEAEAKAAKRNEEARVEALAEAQREHVARDERAWAQARAEECAAAVKEGACDGVRAYLATVPGGHHAGEATAALQAGTPKLAEISRLHDEELARRAAEVSKVEEAAGFRVTSVRVTLEDAPVGAGAGLPGQHLHVAFDLTALVRARCFVADKRMVDVDVAPDAHLDELSPGDTRALDASPYLKRPLHAAPSQCDIAVLKGSGAETSGPVVDSFCYVPGWQDAKDGACAPR